MQRPAPPTPAQELAQLRSEVRMMQCAIADLAANQARREPLPEAHLSAFGMRIIGFSEVTGKGLGALAAKTSQAAEQILRFAEMILRAPRPKG